jgi:alcohol dehydrogenase
MLDLRDGSQTMRACVLEAPDAQPRLLDAPRPEIGPSDVLVRVAASSINPHEAHVMSGSTRAQLEYEFPITLGDDFAGVVVEVGSDVTCLEPCDEVFGRVARAGRPPQHLRRVRGDAGRAGPRTARSHRRSRSNPGAAGTAFPDLWARADQNALAALSGGAVGKIAIRIADLTGPIPKESG